MDHAAADEAWERQHEAEWSRVDQRLRGIAARRAALDAEEAHLLRYAEELRLWRGWGFGSMIEYMERAMGYKPHTAAERLRVARAIAELPLVADALENGELAHSAVRELSRVAVPDTEDAWLEAARGKSLREIEAMVSGHKPGDLPTDATEPRLHRKSITLELSPEAYDLWRRMHTLGAEEHGQRLSDDELITSLFRRAYGDGGGGGGTGTGSNGNGENNAAGNGNGNGNGNGERNAAGTGAGNGGNDVEISSGDGGKSGSPAYKIAIKQCPDCKRAWQYSGGRDIEIDPAVVECAECDAIHLGSLDAAAPERITTTVTARKREQVLARDGHCCTVPGCRRSIGLDVHHVEYQSRGGKHDLWNITTICSLHHKAIHFGKLVVRGRAPDHLKFEFRTPRDRRNVTGDAPELIARTPSEDNYTRTGPTHSNPAATPSPAPPRKPGGPTDRSHVSPTDRSHVDAESRHAPATEAPPPDLIDEINPLPTSTPIQATRNPTWTPLLDCSAPA